jgi:hypothetical protein
MSKLTSVCAILFLVFSSFSIQRRATTTTTLQHVDCQPTTTSHKQHDNEGRPEAAAGAPALPATGENTSSAAGEMVPRTVAHLNGLLQTPPARPRAAGKILDFTKTDQQQQQQVRFHQVTPRRLNSTGPFARLLGGGGPRARAVSFGAAHEQARSGTTKSVVQRRARQFGHVLRGKFAGSPARPSASLEQSCATTQLAAERQRPVIGARGAW